MSDIDFNLLFASRDFFFGVMFGFLADAFLCILFAISSHYIERGLLARDFRRGRLRLIPWLELPDVRYMVKKQISEIDKEVS